MRKGFPHGFLTFLFFRGASWAGRNPTWDDFGAILGLGRDCIEKCPGAIWRYFWPILGRPIGSNVDRWGRDVLKMCRRGDAAPILPTAWQSAAVRGG